jgi:hypothetical protein
MNRKDIKMTLRYAKLSPDSGHESVVSLGLSGGLVKSPCSFNKVVLLG